MGVDRIIEEYREELPEAFKDAKLPPGWEEKWIFVPVEKPESLEDVEDIENVVDPRWGEDTLAPVNSLEPIVLPPVGTGYPGAPQPVPSPYPPPDCFAFYLPFHYFQNPDWWGVYLLEEGVTAFARILFSLSKGQLPPDAALKAARIFLYGHEAFHHAVESFATRLEVSHRRPLYRTGFDRFFKQTVGTDACLEEALACAHGYRLVHRVFKDDRHRQLAVEALEDYISRMPPGYRRGVEFLKGKYDEGKWNLADENYKIALGLTGHGARIWQAFPDAIDGIGRVNSRTNYLVHRDSPLAQRHRLALHYLRRRELVRKLKELAGAAFVREGGNHEVWQAGNGKRFAIPRHIDVTKGTVCKIIKEAGLSLSYEEFLQAEAV